MRRQRVLFLVLLFLGWANACSPGGGEHHALSDKPDFGSITDDNRDPSGTGGFSSSSGGFQGDGDGDFPGTGGSSNDTGGASMGGEGGMGGLGKMGGFGGDLGMMSW